MEVRFARAPADRLFIGCIVALTLVYGGWLLAMRLWWDPPQIEARQGHHGFVMGSSQPPTGGGESSPAAAGEFATSRYGTSGYVFGGGTPRPIAEGARAVVSEPPAASSEPEPAKIEPVLVRSAESATRSGAPEPSAATSGTPTIGRLRLRQVLRQWAVAGLPVAEHQD